MMNKEFKGRILEQHECSDDNPMEQFFGDTSASELKVQNNRIIEIEEVVDRATNIIDQAKVERAGFGILIGVLAILILLFILKKNFVGSIGASMLIIFVFLIMRRVKYFFNVELNHYALNLSLAFQAMFHRYSATKKLLHNAIPIMAWSIVFLVTEHFILRWFLFKPLSSLIYTLGFYGLWIGVVMAFANSQSKEAYRGLLFAYTFYVIALFFSAIYYNDLYYFNVITALLIWLLAGWIKNCNLTDMKGKHRD
ncbi:hypothetical protein NDS46_31525 (plasmid) [Paenibacillus thiaminolyticus]|uniref:hypothetical protein n=1 Tax=Paenibacillus thiaminolyticus TaxID=49283 RepID=UPI00233063B9|nr:hypothetical protein [Paenibacillus thiaminolyticus]WCF11489.1 hypothetical protein NDS46_31525 [Paenibacillus thiaminolyticus]